ncbi:MAG: N-acetylmuramoyl-L-alanine amidase [Rhodospirillales bacterium]|nr:N-acetylmuramoyl-L-alanine amidase [Rhodospirillales bacterium]
MATILAAGGWGVLPAGPATAAGAVRPLIAVDVGHSLRRPGAISARGAVEFAFNQALARVIAQRLRHQGLRTVLIGDDGDLDRLTDRTAAAAAAGATFFLSVHHDSVQPKYLEPWRPDGVERQYSDRFSGYSLFVSHANPRYTQSVGCAEAIGAAMLQAGFRPSLHHAEPIKGEDRPLVDAERGVYAFDDLVVLKTARMPAMLLEAGIIVNRDDEVQLSEEHTRTRIADAVADGLTDCLRLSE